MADVIVKLKVMPTGTEVDLDKLAKSCEEIIKAAGGSVHKKEQEPVAFGLKALTFLFIGDEKEMKIDPIEEKIKNLPEVSTVDIIDVRRAFG